MNSSQTRRLWLIVTGLILATFIIIGRLVVFQVVRADELASLGVEQVLVVDQPERGVIYDRNQAVVAVNGADYQVSAAPNLVDDAQELATDLAPILDEPRYEILAALTSNRPYELLAGRVSGEVADAIRALPYSGIQLDPLPRRVYPQHSLMCHILGYVDFDGNGGAGIEGYYQNELAGEAASATINISPLTVQHSVIAREGADLVLTIDRTLQYTVERHLAEALVEHGAVSGEIIVMDPRTGAILAAASLPCYDPGDFFETPEDMLFNPIVSRQYEPGSVMKLITMAAALDSGTVTPQTTYVDNGILEIGGHRTVNWDRAAHGTVDMTQLLAQSLNVGAATIATWMGTETFYDYFQRFGFGRPTGVDIMAEAAGLMPLPGDALWTESFIATNAYGQSIAVTPLQMIAAVSALANDGSMMQPYVVQEIHSDTGTFIHKPTVLSRAISAETAQTLTNMAITAVNQEVPAAQVPGYTVAGKTGTAQIPENGIYLPDDVIGSFVGWMPADDPEIAVLVKLDRPTSAPWGSQTAAPVFAKLAKELVVILGIPPDDIRLQADIAAARSTEQ